MEKGRPRDVPPSTLPPEGESQPLSHCLPPLRSAGLVGGCEGLLSVWPQKFRAEEGCGAIQTSHASPLCRLTEGKGLD